MNAVIRILNRLSYALAFELIPEQSTSIQNALFQPSTLSLPGVGTINACILRASHMERTSARLEVTTRANFKP